MFKYGYYVLADCIHELKVFVEDNNEIQADQIKQKSNDVLSCRFSKIRAVCIEFCRRKMCNFKSASR